MVELADSYEAREGRDAPRVVCAVDGVRVGRSRTGRWVHLDELPEKTDPDHEVEPVGESTYLAGRISKDSLRQAASDMLRHHGVLHPDADCAWAKNLGAALRF